MNLTETLWWYLENVIEYFFQMLPCMSFALILFLFLRPRRQKRLRRKGLASGPAREGALLLFVLFCAGLAALTLFPAYFWTPGYWRNVLAGIRPIFWPVNFRDQLQTIQTEPFREIIRAFKGRWVMFLMLANIGIFVPVASLPPCCGGSPGGGSPCSSASAPR